MKVTEEVHTIVEGLIADEPALFVVNVILKGNAGNQRLIVILDGDTGVSIEQCSRVSRSLSEVLEERDLIDGKYHLEVSSAGVDFPLQFVRQYQKNVGRSLKVIRTDGDQVSGELKEVKEASIVIEERLKKEIKTHEINFSDIDKSMVLVSFK